jgi:hypothetical protein
MQNTTNSWEKTKKPIHNPQKEEQKISYKLRLITNELDHNLECFIEICREYLTLEQKA